MAAAHFTSSSRGDGDTIDACRHENSGATSGWAGVIVHRRSACTARVRRGQPPPPRCCPPRCCSAHPGRRHCPSRRRRRPHRTSRYRRSVAAMGRPPGLLSARQLRSANAERASRDGVRERTCQPVAPQHVRLSAPGAGARLPEGLLRRLLAQLVPRPRRRFGAARQRQGSGCCASIAGCANGVRRERLSVGARSPIQGRPLLLRARGARRHGEGRRLGRRRRCPALIIGNAELRLELSDLLRTPH